MRKRETNVKNLAVFPTSENVWINLNLVAIGLTPTIHFDRKSASPCSNQPSCFPPLPSSPLKPIIMPSSYTIFPLKSTIMLSPSTIFPTQTNLLAFLLYYIPAQTNHHAFLLYYIPHSNQPSCFPPLSSSPIKPTFMLSCSIIFPTQTNHHAFPLYHLPHSNQPSCLSPQPASSMSISASLPFFESQPKNPMPFSRHDHPPS